MSEYLTISELEEKTGIPNSTCRRYLSTFEAFFLTKGGNRLKKYEERAVDVLLRIKQLYEDGGSKDEIHKALLNDFPLVVSGDKEDGEEQQTSIVPTLATGEDIESIKIALQQQEKFNEELLKRLDQQAEYIKKSLESRDQALLTAIRESQQAKIEATPTKEEKGFFSRLFKR